MRGVILSSFFLFFLSMGVAKIQQEKLSHSFKIYIFGGYLTLSNDYFLHGIIDGGIEYTSFKTGGNAKVYYEKDKHILEALSLLDFQEITKQKCFGFNQLYGTSVSFGYFVYLYSETESFYLLGGDEHLLKTLLSNFEKTHSENCA